MAEPRRHDSWFAEHRSAVFLFCLILFGLCLLVTGLLFEGGGLSKFAGNLFIELSIAAFAGVIATLFLSFEEVRAQLASTIATLFSEGKISALLSSGARDVLHKELTLQRITAAAIEDSLFKELRHLTDEYLQAVHVRNLMQQTVITPYSKDDRFLKESITRRFILDATHLGRPTEFEYKFSYKLSLPSKMSVKPADIFEVFEGKIGSQSFGMGSLKYEPPGAGDSVARFEFSVKTEIEGSVQGFFQYTLLFDREDRTLATHIRYPTKGFSAELRYNHEHKYECAWFQSCLPGFSEFPGTRETQHLRDGLSVGTETWLLPGDGVEFSWIPKPI